MPEHYVRVANADDLPPGQLLQAKAGEEVLCLANIDGQIYAIGNRCPHQAWALANGELDGEEIVCPGHGILLNVPNRTMNACRVAPDAIHNFPVKLEDGAIWVATP